MVLGPFWDGFESFWNGVGIIVLPFWDHFGMRLVSFWDGF